MNIKYVTWTKGVYENEVITAVSAFISQQVSKTHFVTNIIIQYFALTRKTFNYQQILISTVRFRKDICFFMERINYTHTLENKFMLRWRCLHYS